MRPLRNYFILSSSISLIALALLLRSAGLIKGFGWLVPAIIFVVAAGCAMGAVLLLFTANKDRLAVTLTGWLDQRTALGIAFFSLLIIFLLSLMYWASASPLLYGPVYPVWMVPFFAWVTLESVLTLIFITRMQSSAYLPGTAVLILLLAILVSGVLVNLRIWDYPKPHKEDIYFTYLDGRRLLNGENPYARVLSGDMTTNVKYSTYFPVFYGLSWLTQKLGLVKFPYWLSFWRTVFVLVNLLIALLLFWIAGRAADEKHPQTKAWNRVALAAFAALFWLFNRWTLHVSQTADIDFFPLLLLILSLYTLPRHKVLAYLLFGLSLGVKQMGIFLVPLYLIWAWQAAEERRFREVVMAALWIAAIPLLASLPFILWNAKGFLLSIIFSATREPSVAFDVYSLDTLLGVSGMQGKLLMVALMGVLFWISYRHRLGAYTSVLLVLALFVFFNTVMFVSYPVYLMPFIVLVAVELLDRSARSNVAEFD